jgi:hypothetical protein
MENNEDLEIIDEEQDLELKKLNEELEKIEIEKTPEQLDEEYLKLLMNDFGVFLTYVFSYINLPLPTPVQLRLSEILGKNPDRLVLNAYRGFGKSIITGIYADWRLLRNYNEKILIVSGNSSKANEISSFARRLLDIIPLLRHLAPSADMRDSVVSFDVRGADTTIAPSVKVTGIFGAFTGSRASLVIADDIETPENSQTQEAREKLLAKTQEFEALLIPEMKCSIIYLGTPQSAESIYSSTGENLATKYKKIVIPIEVPKNPEIYEDCLDEFVYKMGEPGSPVDVIRFPKPIILEKKAGYSEAGYSLQFMLDTTLSDAEKYPLKLKYLTVLTLNSFKAPAVINHSNSPDFKIKELSNCGFNGDGYFKPSFISEETIEYDYKIMAIDSSGSGKDETACVVLGVLNGNVFLLDVYASTDGASDFTMLNIVKTAKKHQIEKIILEKNFSAGVFTKLLEKFLIRDYNCPIEEIVSKGQKETRIIETLEPVLKNNQLFVNYDVVLEDAKLTSVGSKLSSYSLFSQLTHITYDRNSVKHDDRLDALAMGIAQIKDALVVNQDEELQRYKQEEMERFLNEKIYGKYNSNFNTIFNR